MCLQAFAMICGDSSRKWMKAQKSQIRLQPLTNAIPWSFPRCHHHWNIELNQIYTEKSCIVFISTKNESLLIRELNGWWLATTRSRCRFSFSHNITLLRQILLSLRVSFSQRPWEWNHCAMHSRNAVIWIRTFIVKLIRSICESKPLKAISKRPDTKKKIPQTGLFFSLVAVAATAAAAAAQFKYQFD